MKKYITAAALLLVMAAPADAQIYKDTHKSPKARLNEFLKDTRKGLEKTGKSLSGLLGLDSETDSDHVEIDGVKYMPVYTTHLFKASATEAADMQARCRKDFASRYPKADIISAVIPQRDWIETAVKERKKIASYRRVAHCYVLGRDGGDGYINVRYTFRQTREPGNSWVKPADYWPRFDRADVIPNVHYQQLVKTK